MNKKYIIGIISVVVLVAVVVLLSNVRIVKAIESYFGTVILNNATATTTLSYVRPGLGTTTLAVQTWNADRVDVLLQIKASSTASILNWKYEYSNNGIDWFGEDNFTVTSNIASAHSSTTPVHSYQPNNGDSATTTKMISIPYYTSYWQRIVFSVPIGAGNVGVYAEANIKRNAQ